MSSQRDEILNHEYDGIQEYDNPLPGWWLFGFYGAMVWAVFYAAFYHLGPGLLNMAAFEIQREETRLAEARAFMEEGTIENEAISIVGSSASLMGKAAETFEKECASCHGSYGEGDRGPNLTDEYWLHGGYGVDVHAALTGSMHANGDPSWPRTLAGQQAFRQAAYVLSLVGSNPAGAKAPEGEKLAPAGATGARRVRLAANLATVLADGEAVARGQALFMTRCLPCHLASGGGLVGPNLTDDHYIHGGELPDLFHTISYGVPEKGMVAWEKQLKVDELREVTAFVGTLRGTHVDGGRPPEGELWTDDDDGGA